MWTPELEQELQSLESQYGQPKAAPPIANPKAAQSYADTLNTEKAKVDVNNSVQDASRTQIFPALDKVEKNLEYMKAHGGMSPVYDNEELLFGTLPGVKPIIQAARAAGETPDKWYSGFGRGVGENLANREVYQSSVGALASQVKNVIRKPGEGVWTDSDQKFLLQLLPSGAGYDTDKRIIADLRDGSLLNKIQEYRKSNNIQSGAAQPVTLQGAEPQTPQGAVDYREFFK